MRSRRLLSESVRVLMAVALLSAAPVALAQERPDALQISEVGDRYQFVVPVSRLVMAMPKAGLKRASNPGAASHPRYFYFTGGSLNVSGWFEPAQGLKGIKRFWASET